MNDRNCLVLTQYRKNDLYYNFIGKYYHFPSNVAKNYLNFFHHFPIEFIYYEPEKHGDGVFYGYGKITKSPFEDQREKGFQFVEIDDYKEFTTPVFYKNDSGEIIEKINNEDTYNSNNAVRRISSKFLDEICLDGGILLNFKTDAHLIRILGEQLIGSEKVGILELVKNAIDANASYCKVRFEKIPDLGNYDASSSPYDGPVIIIEDDGVGMSREVIEDGWLRPASTLKTDIKERLKLERKKAEESGHLGTYESIVAQIKQENGGKIPLGEKGVGRFATHRLGRHLIIKTKTSDISYEYVLSIDWDDFDNILIGKRDLDSVGVRLTRQAPSRNYGTKGSGTQIIIWGGREGFYFTENAIRDINRSILRLNSPNPNPHKIVPSFSASVSCPQIVDLDSTDIVSAYKPTFEFDALVSASGIIDEYTLKFSPPASVPMPPEVWTDTNYDLKLADASFWGTGQNATFRIPCCGAFYLHIEAWYRTKPWIDGPEANEMIAYLDEYGGISIYRDNIIIFPAESGTKNDWLSLSQRHIKQGFRMSYYNLIGNIEIDQTGSWDLIDKTNREGMIENQAFQDLAKLTVTIIQNIIEPDFQSEAPKICAPERKTGNI